MGLFNREFLTHPMLTRAPRSDQEHTEFVRVLFDTIEQQIQFLSDSGRLTSVRAIPMLLTGNVGSVQSTLTLTAEDRGASLGSQINIAAHTFESGDVTLTYGAGTLTQDDQGTDLPYSNGGDEIFFVYVDNPDYEDQPTPVYKATDVPQTVSDDLGRYWVGAVLMPTDGGGTTYGGGGGGGGTTGDFTPTNPGQVIP